MTVASPIRLGGQALEHHATGTQPYSNYQPVPVTGAEAREVMDIIQSDTPFPLRPYQEGQGAVQDIIYAK